MKYFKVKNWLPPYSLKFRHNESCNFLRKLGIFSFYFATFSDKDLANDVIKRKI